MVARRLNIPRMAAQALGAKTYLGPPCAKGHPGTRHTANGACVACHANRERARHAAQESAPWKPGPWETSYLAMYHPQDFDRAGWKRAAALRYEG